MTLQTEGVVHKWLHWVLIWLISYYRIFQSAAIKCVWKFVLIINTEQPQYFIFINCDTLFQPPILPHFSIGLSIKNSLFRKKHVWNFCFLLLFIGHNHFLIILDYHEKYLLFRNHWLRQQISKNCIYKAYKKIWQNVIQFIPIKANLSLHFDYSNFITFSTLAQIWRKDHQVERWCTPIPFQTISFTNQNVDRKLRKI